ncbi:T9SS type A sorting domain-containing protein [bacterium]|nr:T9SS type A sorting domain-containing protein [bacterium]RQV95504.1 MAG: T9SS C-terminal target domain-containing protein [bacterium]
MKIKLGALLGVMLFCGMGWGQHFQPVDTTGEFSNIVISNSTIDNNPFQNGDEIGVFDDTLCVGVVVYENVFPVSCPAVMEYITPADDTLEGARQGNPMVFKVWQKNTDTEMEASPIYTSGGHFGDVLTVVDPLSASTTGISENISESQIPDGFDLLSNYPNPFNPETTIRYHLPIDIKTRIIVYDITGQQIRTLVDGLKQAGRYAVQWDGRNKDGIRVGTGNYIVKIEAGYFSKSIKILLMK